MIKEFTQKDTKDVIECLLELQNAESKIELNRKEDSEVAREYFEEISDQVRNKNGKIFCARVGSEIAGLIIVLIEDNDIIDKPGRYAYISDVVVREKYRSKGMATKLMQEAEEFAKQEGIREIKICVLEKNIAALNLYQKTGYQAQTITLRKSI